MPLPAECRVLVDPHPESGSWNMAVDEMLLENAMEQNACALRWYRWDRPTLSLGYFQEAVAAAANPQTAGLPAVRRLTGGGAILHHHEWTYSCAIPASHPLAEVPHRLYVGIHEQIIGVLGKLGISCRMRGASRPELEGLFLCFDRGDERDIVCGSKKIVGSAQRRRRRAVLQHGSVLLSRSKHAPEFPGISDLTPGLAIPDDLSGRLVAAIVPILAATGRFDTLTPGEKERGAELQRERYDRLDWQSKVEKASGS